MELLAIEADIDYRLGRREGEPFIEFAWEGTDDGQPISGRAWALLEKGGLRGRLFIHGGDEAGFVGFLSGVADLIRDTFKPKERVLAKQAELKARS